MATLLRVNATVRSIVRTAFVRFTSALGSLLLTVVLARTLPKESVGEFAVAFTVMAILSMMARFGYDITLLRFGGALWTGGPSSGFRGLSRFALGSVVRNALVLATVATVVALVWLTLEHTTFFVLMLVLSVPWSLMYVVSFLLKAVGLAATGSVFEVGMVSVAASAVLFALHQSGREASLNVVAIVLLATTASAFAIGIAVLAKRGLIGRDVEAYDDNEAFFRATRNVAAVMVVQLLANQSGNLILRLVADPEEVATFSVALRLATATLVAFNVIYIIAGPRISAAHAQGDTAGAVRIARRFTTLLILLAGPVLLALSLAPSRITVIFGSQYESSAGPVAIMAIGQLLALAMGLGPIWLAMTGGEAALRNVTLTSAAISLVVTFALASRFGANGAAVGVACYQVGYYWLGGIAARRRDGVALWPATEDISRVRSLRRSP